MGKRTKRSADRKTQAASPAPKRRTRVVRLGFLLLLAVGVILGWAFATRATRPNDAPPVDGYQIVNTYPHDPRAFSQGLAFSDGFLYEGTGQYGESTLRQVELESGKVRRSVPLHRELFGEGITVFAGDIIQLTWRSRMGIVYDKESFKPRGFFRYSGEGWGITTDGKQLIMSDGTSTLRFLDPKTYGVVKRLTVRDQRVPVRQLNELEWVEGEIYANVWGSDRIARISPETGQVLGWIDLAGLLKRGERRDANAVLNGIAYDPQTKRLFVTGKLWPKLFEIRVASRSGAERRQRPISR